MNNQLHYTPHIQAITNLTTRIKNVQPPLITAMKEDATTNLSKEQLISIFFTNLPEDDNDDDNNNSRYASTSILQYTAPFKTTVRICTPPNDEESTIINSSEEFQLYVMTEHLLLFNWEHAYKIHFSDILMHGVQQQPQICMYCQLACSQSAAAEQKAHIDDDGDDDTIMEDDEGFESVCEMIIQLQVQSSALEQIYNQLYQAFSRAAENVPLSGGALQQEDNSSAGNSMFKFDPKSLDDKLSINTDGWIYNVEEMRRGVLIRDRLEREENDDEEWEDVEEDEEKSKKLKM